MPGEPHTDRPFAETPEEDPADRRRWRCAPPLAGMRCAFCGSTKVSSLPTFSVGSGVAQRPLADDLYCRHCGRIAPAAY